MKAEELRIGNVYMSVKFGEPVKWELTDFTQLDKLSDGAYNDPPIEEMIEPIPLTDECLLRFKFSSHHVRDYYFKDCGEYEIRCVVNSFSGGLNNDASWFVSIQTGYGSQPVTLVRKYVHELQNLYFALTGEELKLKL